MLPAGPNTTTHAAAEQENQPSHVLTALTADSPSSSSHKPTTASATGIHPHAATYVPADTHSDNAPVHALPGGQPPAPELSKEAVLASHIDTTPHKVSASAAKTPHHAVEAVSTDALPTSVQLPIAPQTDPHTDRQRQTASASVSPTAVISPTSELSRDAVEEGALAVELPASPELSSTANALAPAPAGPDVVPALARGKAQTREDGAALVAGLSTSPPHPSGQAPAQASSNDTQVAIAPPLDTQSAAACLAVATGDSMPADPAEAVAADGAKAVDQAGTTDAAATDAVTKDAVTTGAVTTDTGTTDAVTTDAVTTDAVTTDATQQLPAAALQSAILPAGEIGPSAEPSAPSSVPQQVKLPNDLAVLSLQDSVGLAPPPPESPVGLTPPPPTSPIGLPPPPPTSSVGLPPPPPTSPPLTQVVPRNLALHSDADAAVPTSAAPTSAQTPGQWWTLCHTAGLATGLAREAATAQHPTSSQHQAGVQVSASEEAPPQKPPAAPSANQAKGQGAAPMEISVGEQAAAPASHEIPALPANSLSVPTASQLAVPAMEGAAVDCIPNPTAEPPHSQVCTPPSTEPMESHGMQAMNASPSITAVRAAGSEEALPAAEHQLPPGKPSRQQSAVAATAGASASAVAPAAPATAGASASAVTPAVAPIVKPQPKRVTRFKQNAATKEAAAPAASPTTTTSSGKTRGVDLVGQRIEVWWSGEDKFLPGVVTAFTPSKVLPLRDIVSSGLM